MTESIKAKVAMIGACDLEAMFKADEESDAYIEDRDKVMILVFDSGEELRQAIRDQNVDFYFRLDVEGDT